MALHSQDGRATKEGEVLRQQSRWASRQGTDLPVPMFSVGIRAEPLANRQSQGFSP